MTVNTDFFIGSVPKLCGVSLTTGVGTGTISEGAYYLYDSSDSTYSLLDAVAAALSSAGHTGHTVTLTQARLVSITFTSATTLAFGDAVIRDLLGFTGDQSSAATHTASLISPLLWSPAQRGIPLSPVGTDGIVVDDTAVTFSATGQTVNAVRSATQTRQRWTYDLVVQGRVWTSAEAGGEYRKFVDRVLRPHSRFLWYENMEEDEDASSTDVTWGTRHGPYVASDPRQLATFWQRVTPNRDTYAKLTLDAVKVAQYS